MDYSDEGNGQQHEKSFEDVQVKNTIFKNRGGVDNQHHGPIKATQPSKNFMQTISNDDDNSVLGD
jgi:hypothetical protein